MKRQSISALLLGFLLAACQVDLNVPHSGHTAPLPDYTLDERGYVKGEVLMGYETGADAAELARQIGGTLRADYKEVRIALVKLPEGVAVEKAVTNAQNLEGLRYAEPNYLRKREDPIPTVEGIHRFLSPSQVGISDPDFNVQWMHRQLNTEGAWNEEVTGKSIRIGILDDFLDHRHPDLVDNVLYPGLDGFKASELQAAGESFEDAFRNAFITTDTPHDGVGFQGTQVAGIASATANNIGGRGTAYGAQIVPLAFSEPETNSYSEAGIITAALFAVLGPDLAPGGDDRAPGTDPNAGPYVHIVNMSFGQDEYVQFEQDVMNYMLTSGIALVTSAGDTPNEGQQYPAWTPGVISVAATEPQGKRTEISHRGLHLDVAAPGESIWTTATRSCVVATPDGSSCSSDDNDYIFIDGTSSSSAATAGVAAMILEASAERDAEGNITDVLSAAQVGHILRETAFKPDGYDKTALGAGIVDAEAAIARALENASDPVEDGASLIVKAVLAGDPGVIVPNVGLTLIPREGDNPVEYTQTSDEGLFNLSDQGVFQQLDAGTYTLQASGPYTTVYGGAAATFEKTVTLAPGEVQTVEVALDVDLSAFDPFEPNATQARAAELEGSGVTLRASFYDKGSGSDKDVYALPVTRGESYRVNVESAFGTFDSALTVTSEDGTVLAENDDNQAFTSDSLVTFTAPDDGVVFVTVSAASGAPEANSPFILYDLDVATLVGTGEEPNGSSTAIEDEVDDVDVSDAQSVPLGSALDASLTGADTDIFAVEVAAGETVVADLETVESGEPDTLLAVYNADGEQIAFNDDYTGQNSRTSFTADADGTYYVLVTAWDSSNPEGASVGDYGLSVTSVLNP